MEKLSLAELLDTDREMVLAGIARDRSLPAAQSELEKEIDRVMYRYVEQCEDEALRDCAQYILQTMKNTLPVMDTVGEAREWKKQFDVARRSLAMGRTALAFLIGGALLIFASVLALVISGRMTGALAFVKALLPVTLGGAGLFWAGVLAARPKPRQQALPDASAVRTEYLVDDEKAWHCMRGAMLQADGQLERLREERAASEHREEAASPQGELTPAMLELFGELLESTYAAGDENAMEAASAIRFYLHNAKVDVVDYAEGNERWFEFLPASGHGTIRPALVSEGRLLRKGMASR